jgi:hypothetical protein
MFFGLFSCDKISAAFLLTVKMQNEPTFISHDKTDPGVGIDTFPPS